MRRLSLFPAGVALMNFTIGLAVLAIANDLRGLTCVAMAFPLGWLAWVLWRWDQ